ncbi:hypothetical protein BU26DRAFT_327959 [Trematosphaeria pertusa]|uniref:Secreted protein n=1 Tax=Trematosphaeria pertusa TaxID=390896 RepID=A0A6A6ICK6_9PLEO|nr:uncharacterized protein BU26DRAFT_327959 [Trematosphaeria pertusa]KAF2248146.1 hypothetical protein BU26DRAFT_327959 [Trematosphaeria pertusa]
MPTLLAQLPVRRLCPSMGRSRLVFLAWCLSLQARCSGLVSVRCLCRGTGDRFRIGAVFAVMEGAAVRASFWAHCSDSKLGHATGKALYCQRLFFCFSNMAGNGGSFFSAPLTFVIRTLCSSGAAAPA